MFVLPFFNRVSSWFGPRNISVPGASKYHKGIDLAAPEGTPVFAAQKGVVTVKQSRGGYGNVVYITHPDGSETRYGHLSGFTDIQAGMEIEAGTQIGFVGSTGNSSGPHLHFELRDANGNAVDPQFILGDSVPKGGFYQNVGGYSVMPPLSDWENIRAKLKAEEEKTKNTLSFSYRSTKKKPKETSIPGQMFSGVLKSLFGSGSLLGELLNPEKEASEKPAVDMTLSKKDMLAHGFTEEEINKIATLSEDKQRRVAAGTLAVSGESVSSNDLREIGIDEYKIRQFDALAARKQGNI